MWSTKRLATQLGKPYRAMRSASLAAFTRALHEATASETSGRAVVARGPPGR
jgi:hypothetical protein